MAQLAATLIRQSDSSVLPADAVVKVDISRSINITEHPLETGASVSDHAVALLPSFVLEVITTETPTRRDATSRGAARVQSAVDWLQTSQGQLLDLVIERLGTYTNCLISRWPHTIDGVRRLRFTIELKQVQIALAESVTISASDPVEEEGGTSGVSEVDTGTQPTTDTVEENPEAAEEDSSVLYDLIYGSEEEDTDAEGAA